MRKFKVVVQTPFGDEVEYFELPDNASPNDIEEEARDVFLNICNFGFHEVTEGEDDGE